MLDKNNIKRVKGILSAKNGTEIPRSSLNGYNYIKTKGYQTIYSNDGQSWFTDPTLKNPYTGDDVSSFKDEVLNTSGGYTIPGDPNLTPTTAVEESAKQMEAISNQKNLQDAQIKATQLSLNIPKPTSINDGVINIPDIMAAIPKQIEVPDQIKKEVDSYGMRFKQEKEQRDQKQEKAEKLIDAAKIGAEVFQGIGSAIGQAQKATDSNLTKGVDAAYGVASDVVSSLGPVGSLVGSAMKNAAIAGDVIQSLGGGTDQMSSNDQWMDYSFFSWNVGMLNGFAGKKADSFAVDQDIASEVGSSYGGTMTDLANAANKAGKKYGLFSASARRKANRQIADAKTKQNLMGNIADEANDQRLAVQSMGEQAGLAYSLMVDGGYDQKYTYAAKHGGLLEWNPTIELEWQPQIELNWELPEFKEGGYIELQEELEWVPEFKNGGRTEESNIPEIEETTQKNVIPEGALHKNKHHMEHAEGLTKKGIPVIDEDGEQQAEIEHSEIIFTLEVTKKLEEYYDIFYSDETTNKEKEQAALEAGKLLVYQILENTEDRTGLIESCKKGGTLTLKKSTDDLIEEVLEWMPVIAIVEETIEESKKEEPQKKSEKEQMKEAIKEVLVELLTK